MSVDSDRITWDDVLSFVKEHDMQPDELDDLVYDAKTSEASNLNNAGVEAQLSYLRGFHVDPPDDLKTILKEQVKIQKGK